jgi:hypothetical protein
MRANPGWFANKPKDPSAETTPKVNSGWPPRAIGREVRKFLKEAAGRLTWRGTEALIDAVPYLDAIAMFLETLEPQPTNMYEARLEQQLRANFSSPKTLDDLQRMPGATPLVMSGIILLSRTMRMLKKDKPLGRLKRT